MKTIYNIYEGALSDIDDTISKSDDAVNALSELAEARKLKSAFFAPDKKEMCSFMFNCPALLNRCLDLKVKHKIASKKLGTPTSLQLWYEYDSTCETYTISIRINNENKYCPCLCIKSQWICASRAKSAEVANKLLDYMLKSEDHFKTMLALFDSNHISYNSHYKFFEAPAFSPILLVINLRNI